MSTQTPLKRILSKFKRFLKQDFFQGRSARIDRLIFSFFAILNFLGKALSTKGFKQWLYAKLMDYLLKPLSYYESSQMYLDSVEDRQIFIDYKKKRFLEAAQPGDVVLVRGEQRISRIIQNLTQSPYSHVAYYRGEGNVIEVEPEGVIISSIDKYLHLDIRICRPVMLSKQARKKVEAYLEEMMERQPRYDLANIEKLLFKYWYSKFRPDVKMYLGGSTKFETYYLCSGLLAHAFQKAGYPIVPSVRINRKHNKPLPELGDTKDYFEWVAHAPKNYSQIVPADFDNSSFFASIKFLFMTSQQQAPKRQVQWDE